MVAQERGQPGPLVSRRWHATAEALRAELAAGDPHRRVVWVAGTLSVTTLATTRLAETWIHTGDVAAAFDVELPPTDRLWHIARLAWRTLPYAFMRDGREQVAPVAFRLTGPGGDQWDFLPAAEAETTIEGDALELCLVAARRIEPGATRLKSRGPDASAVLDLVRTYA
jgi:uncharacterized protein (TIGR03084 family)